VKYFDWNKEKNELLKSEREVSFEEIVEAINTGNILDEFDHPNQKKYPAQKVYVIEIRGYVYFVPYVEDEEKKFLKTIYPNRDLTKKYLKK
jgi:hypothetical protein